MSRTTTYATDHGDLVIEFDYQPEEEATDVSPGTPDSADVLSVMAGDFDILEWCSDASIAAFEEACMESVQFERECAECDYAGSRSEQ